MRKAAWAFLLVLCGFAVTVWVANRDRHLPAAPELAAVDLTLLTQADSKPLEALLDKGAADSSLKGAVFDRARKALGRGQWLANPRALLSAIDGRVNPSTAAVRRAILAPGCVPISRSAREATRYRYLRLYAGLRLLVAKAIVSAQLGKARRGLGELEALQTRLLTLQRDCSHTLLVAAILEAGVGLLRSAWGYLLAVPAGADGKDLQARVWPRLRALETRANPTANTLRGEYAFVKAFLLIRKDAGKDKNKNKGKNEGKGATKTSLGSWPRFDREATLALLARISKRGVWLAEKPLDDPAWRHPDVERVFFERVRKMPRWRRLLRYNATGEALLSTVVTPGTRSFALRWHRARCLAAAHRALWAEQLSLRKRPLDSAAKKPPPTNPITGRVFGSLLASDHPCKLPKGIDGAGPTGSTSLTSLPRAPRGVTAAGAESAAP